jgi:hypothetical protein
MKEIGGKRVDSMGFTWISMEATYTVYGIQLSIVTLVSQITLPSTVVPFAKA